MAAPAFVQKSAIVAASASATSVTLNGVVAGGTLVVFIFATTASNRTYTISDDKGNTWSAIVESQSGNVRKTCMFRAENVASGNTVITVTQSGTLVAYSILANELGQSTFEQSSASTYATNVTTHYGAASGSLDTAANAIILAGGVLNASGGTMTKKGSFTLIDSNTILLLQYLRTDAGISDERGEFTSSTARNDTCLAVSFVSANGGISGSSSHTEADDILSSSSALVIAASSGSSEADDTLSSAGVLPIVAVLSITEGDDTNSASGQSSSGNQGSSTITEGDDTLVAAATIRLTATSGAVEGNDTISCTAGVRIAAAVASLELDDTVNAAASIGSASNASNFYSMMMR